MKTSAKTIAAVSSLLGVGALALSAPTFAADKPGMEKCYGVAKAGKNDCAGASHACAGQSTAAANAKEWVYLPMGTCERLVGGTRMVKK